jgi:hypothetical protein
MQRLDVSGASVQQKKKILHYAADVRKFEIERFWQRSIFFWGFIGAAFIAFAALKRNDANYFYNLIVACFGFVSSVAWTLQNRGSKYWQEAWEQKVEAVEQEVLGAPLFSNWEPLKRKGAWGASLFSVSRLAVALSDFVVFIWLVLLAVSFSSLLSASCLELIAAVSLVIVTLCYAVFLLVLARTDLSGEPKPAVVGDKTSEEDTQMTDNNSDYRRSAEVVFVQLRQMQEFSLRMMGEYGRWLISSLLFLHVAALGGLLFKAGGTAPPPYLHALWWFVAGIVLAFSAGFSAWWNFSYAAEQYHRWADHRMLTDRNYWPSGEDNSGIITFTKRVALGAGVLSILCLVGGAIHVSCTWQ